MDNNLYVNNEGNNTLIVIVNVDDLIFGSDNNKFVDYMKNELEISMMGELSYFLGLQSS